MGCIIEKLYLLLYQTVFSIGEVLGKCKGGVYIRCEMTPTSVGGKQQISISGGSQSPIWYSLRQDCRDAQKKYVMHCMTRISQQECRGVLETDEVTACWKEMRYVNKMIKIWQNVMWVIDSILTSCYYDVSIIPYWTYEVLTVIRVAVRRGNQVRILSDPVTVTEERLFDIPLYDSMRRGKEVMILKSGNLLCMARLNFRVKCNNQLRVSATQSVVCLLEAGIFLWNSPVRMNYTYMYRGGRHIHTTP